jgi:hypothetical protein
LILEFQGDSNLLLARRTAHKIYYWEILLRRKPGRSAAVLLRSVSRCGDLSDFGNHILGNSS